MDAKADQALEAPRPGDYKSDIKPVWCPGCGDFAVLSALTKALVEMALPRETVGLVTGIGCSSRLPAYLAVYGFHAIHGRALPVATGLKAARPDLTVIAAGGDGDGFSIGGNHFVHACRRNVDLTYVVMDNAVYGMTKGQASPTTEADWTGSKLTPDGTGTPPFRPLEMALSSGANFIARGFSGNPNQVAKLICEAVAHPGFSLVQVLSPCVTFRPEQRDLKKVVHPDWDGMPPATDRREAFLRLLDDDGVTTGVVYKGDHPGVRPPRPATASVADLERSFAL